MGFSFEDDENILEPDRGSDCKMLWVNILNATQVLILKELSFCCVNFTSIKFLKLQQKYLNLHFPCNINC